MHAPITLRRLSYSTPDGQTLFSNLDLTFGSNRTGLIGRNGVGKSTLVRLITGELWPASGTIEFAGSLGVLRQTVQVDDDQTIADLMGAGEGLARLERIMSGNALPDDNDEADWTLPSRIDTALAKTGLPDFTPERPLKSLSGGQRTRVSLAALILGEPDMILLDEPTNNLDADGRTAVADLLRNWRGGAVVVSHDRELLEQMDAII